MDIISSSPKHILNELIKYLNFKDVLALFCLKKSLYKIMQDDLIWRNLCKSHGFLRDHLTNEKEMEQTFKQFFISQVLQLKKIKRVMCRKLDQLEITSKQVHQKPITEFLFDPVEATEEAILKQHFPNFPMAYYNFYRVLRQCQDVLGYMNKFFLGGCCYNDIAFGFGTQPIQQPPCNFLKKNGWFLLSKIIENVGFLVIDVPNKLGLGRDTVFSVICKNLQLVHEQIKIVDIFVYAQKLDDMLENFDKTTKGNENNYLSLLNTVDCCLSDVTTNGVRVRADCIFVPWDPRCNKDKFFYVYQIRISFAGCAGRSRLLRRKWWIKEKNKDQKECEGPGVMNQYPEIYYGCEDFVYVNWISIDGFTATLKGQFEFLNLENQQTFYVQVGQFQLKPRKGQMYLQYDIETEQKNIIYQ